MVNSKHRANRVSVNYGDLNEDIISRAAHSISSTANSPDNQKPPSSTARKSYNLDALAKLSGTNNHINTNSNYHSNSNSTPNSPVDNYGNNQIPFPKFDAPSVGVTNSSTQNSSGAAAAHINVQPLSGNSNNSPTFDVSEYPINNDMINNSVKMAGIGNSETTTEMNIAAFNANRDKRIAQHLKRSNVNKNGHNPSKSIATAGLGLVNLDILAANNIKSLSTKNRHDKRHSIHVSSPTISGSGAPVDGFSGYPTNNSNYLLSKSNSNAAKKKNRYSSFDRTDIEKANQVKQYLDVTSPKADYDMDLNSYSYPKNRSSSNPSTILLSPSSACSTTPHSAVESRFPTNSARSKSINFHTRNRSLSVRPTINTNNNNINILDNSNSNSNNSNNNLDGNNVDFSINSPIDKRPTVPCFDYFQQEYPHCIPVHVKTEKSLLSSMKDLSNTQTVFNSQVSFFGIKNLIFLLVSVNNFGLLLEYYSKYFNMTLVRSIWFTVKYNTDLKTFLTCSILLSPCYFLGVYIIEKTLYWVTSKKFNSIVNRKYNQYSNDVNSGDDHSHSALKDKRNSLTSGNDLDDSILDIGSLNDNGNALSSIRNGSLLQKNYAAPLGIILYFAIVSFIFIVNNMIIVKYIYNPLLGTILEVNTIVIIFKIISYGLTNNNLRGLYFRSINPRKYARYLRHLRRFINDDGTVNVSHTNSGGVVRNADEEELLLRKGAVMTGMELTETLKSIKQRKEFSDANTKGDRLHANDSQESMTSKHLKNYIDYNLQPQFYEGNYYPKNVSIRNILYFVSVPTMIYQPVYPSKSKVNWKYCFDKFLEIIILFWGICYLSLTYAIPILEKNILHSAHFTDTVISDAFGNNSSSQGQTHVELLATMLKVANMSIIIWIMVYYIVFHDYLNLLAELTKFEDREFYDQWWNCSSVSLYWKLWNRVFSRFFEHHIYIPLMIHNDSPNGRSSATTAVSNNSGSNSALDVNGGSSNSINSGALGASGINGGKVGSVSSASGIVMIRSDEYYNKMILSQNNSVNFMVFLIMATMQEFIVGIPTGNLMGISFICILMQWPLSFLTSSLETIRGGERSTIGNMIFWISFIVGQPLCILLYFFSWSIKFGEMSSSY